MGSGFNIFQDTFITGSLFVQSQCLLTIPYSIKTQKTLLFDQELL